MDSDQAAWFLILVMLEPWPWILRSRFTSAIFEVRAGLKPALSDINDQAVTEKLFDLMGHIEPKRAHELIRITVTFGCNE